MSISSYPPNDYPVGAVVQCPFYFASRALTAEEYATFLAGGGLPAGVGVDPVTVMFRYKLNGVTVNVAPVKDATGLYHAVIPVTQAGDYEWQGYGEDAGGNPFAAMTPRHFTGMAF